MHNLSLFFTVVKDIMIYQIMKIGFVNFTPLAYNVTTPYNQPLGGSESSMCYLAAALAKIGHEVTLFGRVADKNKLLGVRHELDTKLTSGEKLEFDVFVVQNTPFFGMQIKRFLNPNCKLIHWNQHNPDQPAVRVLNSRQFVEIYDAIVFVSQWQKERYLSTFKLNPQKCFVLKNAVSPAFQNLINTPNVLKLKSQNPTLAYITVPQRGLDVLLDIFPKLKLEFPKLRLKIFSSMRVYQKEEDPHTLRLYEICKSTHGVEYVGSISQKRLARELIKISILSYPNIVPETFCIGIIEALAAGCLVVTSKLGAIPETSAGFAKLVEIDTDREKYCQNFTKMLRKAIKLYTPANKSYLNVALAKAISYQNKFNTWSIRAKEWQQMLSKI